MEKEIESYKCFCKGIRTCNICKDQKLKITKNKESSSDNVEVINLNKLITKKDIKNINFYENCDSSFYSGCKSDFNKNFADVYSNPPSEKIISEFSIVANADNENAIKSKYNLHVNLDILFMIQCDLTEEIIYESKGRAYYQPLLKFISTNKDNYGNSDQVTENLNQIFNGFYVIKNFLNESEQEFLVKGINEHNWLDSQSGRKKQDYGPKINYKKKKIRIDEINLEMNINKNEKQQIEDLIDGNFQKKANDAITSSLTEKYRNFTFPYFSKEKCCFFNFVSEKLKEINRLKDFKIAEIGNLFYDYSKGGHIEPHVDDAWIWGDRIIGINLLSETKMTFSREIEIINDKKETERILIEFDFPVGKGDLYVISDLARYVWRHSIKKEHITKDRLVMTLRELEKNFLFKYFIPKIIH